MSATGMSRPWVYHRLRELADRGRVVQVGRGDGEPSPSDVQ